MKVSRQKLAEEIGFLDGLLDRGLIEPERLTGDADMADRIRSHPLLQWKALNVIKNKAAQGPIG